MQLTPQTFLLSTFFLGSIDFFVFLNQLLVLKFLFVRSKPSKIHNFTKYHSMLVFVSLKLYVIFTHQVADFRNNLKQPAFILYKIKN